VCGVDEKFHCLSGETMTFSQDGLLQSGDDFANLKASLAPPANRRYEKINQMSFFNEEYGKRLFGNAWNIPTIEALLQPLTQIFAEQDYEGYDYQYSFIDPNVRVPQSQHDDSDDEEEEEEDEKEDGEDYSSKNSSIHVIILFSE